MPRMQDDLVGLSRAFRRSRGGQRPTTAGNPQVGGVGSPPPDPRRPQPPVRQPRSGMGTTGPGAGRPPGRSGPIVGPGRAPAPAPDPRKGSWTPPAPRPTGSGPVYVPRPSDAAPVPGNVDRARQEARQAVKDAARAGTAPTMPSTAPGNLQNARRALTTASGQATQSQPAQGPTSDFPDVRGGPAGSAEMGAPEGGELRYPTKTDPGQMEGGGVGRGAYPTKTPMAGGPAAPRVNPALGSIATGPDGSRSVTLNEAGKAAWQRMHADTKRRFGKWPGSDNPDSPQPQIIPGEKNFNPFSADGWVE